MLNIFQASSLDPVLSLVGYIGPDRLTGSSRGNILNGRAGADIMAGHDGNDRYYVDNAGDRVMEAEGGGNA